jgi:hypothetical protein
MEAALRWLAAATPGSAAFTSQGGAAIQWKMGTNPVSDLAASLRQWLDTDTRPVTGPASQSTPATS